MRAPPVTLVGRLLRSSPLRFRRFRVFYLGSVGTAFGYTMQATLAAWLMATLTPSALMVALVQSASATPSLLFGLAAGTLADIVDRRRVLLASQLLLLAATAALGLAALAGLVGPATLLALTFLIGTGFTFYMPTQEAMIKSLPATVQGRDLVIAVDAGHGGQDPGALGRGGTREKDVTLAIARRLARAIDAEEGMRAVLIRDGDYFITLRGRIRKAR